MAGLIGEVGDFREYKTISEILKFAGLDLLRLVLEYTKGNDVFLNEEDLL
ncbi:MAG: hypothetical protein MRK02_11225 [Candidatus Scalindua sp.]|nr:hypothetical protein [Candidatus Scalindua sp.]